MVLVMSDPVNNTGPSHMNGISKDQPRYTFPDVSVASNILLYALHAVLWYCWDAWVNGGVIRLLFRAEGCADQPAGLETVPGADLDNGPSLHAAARFHESVGACCRLSRYTVPLYRLSALRAVPLTNAGTGGSIASSHGLIGRNRTPPWRRLVVLLWCTVLYSWSSGVHNRRVAQSVRGNSPFSSSAAFVSAVRFTNRTINCSCAVEPVIAQLPRSLQRQSSSRCFECLWFGGCHSVCFSHRLGSWRAVRLS